MSNLLARSAAAVSIWVAGGLSGSAQAPEVFATTPVVQPSALPAPAADGDRAVEIAELRARLDDIESSNDKRTKAEADKKAPDALKPTVKWTGQLQADFYAFDQDEANRARFGDIENGEAFRRARFGIFGDYGPAEYRIEMDFALGGRPSFLDVWTGLNDVPYLGRVRVGHFFEPFSLERYTPNRFTTFMERSLSDQTFAPARNMGVMANDTYLEERGTWAVGFFRSDSDVFGDDVGDDFENAATGRVTYLPWCECEGTQYAHLGIGYSLRGTNDDQVRFRAQPEARIGAANPNVPFFVDTGNIPASSFQLVGLEAALVNGPLSLVSEYFLTPVNAIDGDDLLFHGWYAEAGYFLTGEHRPYRRKYGIFDRVMPHREFIRDSKDKRVECGPGAWQLAARISGLDLDDGPVRGGKIVDTTLGLNWYLNPYLRVTANWVHAFVDDAPGDGGESDADVFATRVNFDF
ncbi:MAG: porin [Planctomycetota bacterium]|nr:porin [Planctomycetaceae bacterium]MDQ3329216.1 porin [Planctomycetota bacterium]